MAGSKSTERKTHPREHTVEQVENVTPVGDDAKTAEQIGNEGEPEIIGSELNARGKAAPQAEAAADSDTPQAGGQTPKQASKNPTEAPKVDHPDWLKKEMGMIGVPKDKAALGAHAEKEGPPNRSRRIMKRCFMTGKQCIFSSQIAEQATGELRPDTTSVFVAMPFRPNLNTFYEWCLKPYLATRYQVQTENIHRADEASNIGNIVCERICRQIQEADIVVADVSTENANVFYELGLAYGLQRPVVLMHNGESTANEAARWTSALLESPSIQQCLDIKDQKNVFTYDGVIPLDPDHKEDHRLGRYVRHPQKSQKRGKSLSISVLVTEKDGPDTGAAPTDIWLGRKSMITGAVTAAMTQICESVAKKSDEPWQALVKGYDKDEWARFSTPKPITVGATTDFASVADELESSFCTIIDVSTSDAVSYFWLGYCHARGLNAVPVFRVPAKKNVQEPDAKTAAEERNVRISKLAFDIRALWYAEYDESEPDKFRAKIRETLEHLLARDLPNRQKRAFWERLPQESKLAIFAGAVHIPDLNREMIGDWDLRTASELLQYLPSVREGTQIELVTPIHSPDEIFSDRQAKQPNTNRDTFLEEYCSGLEALLSDCNAIVIASADVNPVTEFLLHKLYGLGGEPFRATDDQLANLQELVGKPDGAVGKRPASYLGASNAWVKSEMPWFDGYVLVKKVERVGEANPETGREQQPAPDKHIRQHFPRVFCRNVDIRNPSGEGSLMRGFARHRDNTVNISDTSLLRPYVPQAGTPTRTTSEDHPAPFVGASGRSSGHNKHDGPTILGHVVIAQNPCSQSNWVLILNGVSGPATSGIAQVLTGGRGTVPAQDPEDAKERNKQSEDLLQKINALLDSPQGATGVEAVVLVEEEIVKRSGAQTSKDVRVVKWWDFLHGHEPQPVKTLPAKDAVREGGSKSEAQEPKSAL